MQIRKQLLYMIFFIFSILLFGCWDREELNDIALVLSMGFDYINEETIQVSVEVELPGSVPSGPNATGDEQATFVHSASGRTVAEALGILQHSFSRRLFLSHNRVIVFGEEYARKYGIGDEIEFVNSFPESRLRSLLYVTDLQAKQLLANVSQLQGSTAKVLANLSDIGVVPTVTLKDAMMDHYVKDLQIYIPLVTISKDTTGDLEGKHQIIHSGSAIFKDKYMVDKLDLQLTDGLLWLINKIELGTLTIQPIEAENEYISTLLIGGSTRLIPSIENGRWRITVKVISEHDVIQNTSNLDLTRLENLHSIEDQLQEELIRQMKETLQKVQHELKSDVIGFSNIFHKRYPKEWREKHEQWETFFPEIEVEYDVKVYIRRIDLED